MAPQDPTLQCPRCQSALTPRRGELGEAACGSCGGRYLGSHAVQRVLVEEQGFSLAFLRQLTQLVGAPRVTCPECRLDTSPIPLRGRVLDLCLHCGGLWADAGELTAVSGGRHADSDAPGPMPPPPPPPRRAPPPGGSVWPELINLLVRAGVLVAALLVVANLAFFAVRLNARSSRVDQDRLADARMRARRDAVPPAPDADHAVVLEAARAFLRPRVPQWAEPGVPSDVKTFNGRCGLVTLERGGHHFRLFADFVDGDGWQFSLSRPQRDDGPAAARLAKDGAYWKLRSQGAAVDYGGGPFPHIPVQLETVSADARLVTGSFRWATVAYRFRFRLQFDQGSGCWFKEDEVFETL